MMPLEVAANLATTIAILLAGRNSVHTWWVGIVGCALFAAVFLQARLYADVVLQVFFMVASAIGWWQWLHGDAGKSLNVSSTASTLLGWAVLAGVATTVGYGSLLHRFTDAYAPFTDSAVLAFSVIGQILLMQRRVETWGFWLLVNTLAVPLYASRGLHLTAVLYAVYWVNAVVSWRHWSRLMRGEIVAHTESEYA